MPAERGYDSDKIIHEASDAGMTVVIPPRRNRKYQRDYDRYLQRFRHLAENAFLKLKRWRGTAARYVKYRSLFVAAAQIRCIALWAEILV